jgi:alginate O-acetyltransferase complex protein AlgI
MLFNSFIFVKLFIVTFLVFYIPQLKKYQIPILIISSLIFYGYNQPILLLLLLFSAAINIATSYQVVYGNQSLRKFYVTAGVIINITILAVFKYSPLISVTFFPATNDIGQFLLTIPLPIGISFYTFEGISLLVDVYSNKHKDYLTIDKSVAQHSIKTLFFISFFPHLVSGPILKAYEFYPQIKEKYFADIKWESAVKTLILGYFLKTVVADNINTQTFWIVYPYFIGYSSLNLVVMLFGYSCQIFADFAGYSLIAIGLAKLLGFDLIQNFNFPYISTSFSEFWRRWHISLSTFLKEYLYIPLGGNRKGNIRTYINLMITMILGGLWHGAASSYLVWGTFHGSALALERFAGQITKPVKQTTLLKIAKGFMVFGFVTLAWLLFKLPHFAYAIEYLKSIGKNRNLTKDSIMLFLIPIYCLPVILFHLFYVFKVNENKVFNKYQYLIYGFLLFMIIVNSGPSGSFIYFQF